MRRVSKVKFSTFTVIILCITSSGVQDASLTLHVFCLCVKDGAYMVRDSTRQLTNQPFTLMVFYQDKVYNIQIRQQDQRFMLGTGLKAHEVTV